MFDVVYHPALFLHILAAAGMIAGGVVQVFTSARLPRARTTSELVSWATFARSAGPLILASAAISLFTGGHLAGLRWTFSHPFVTLGAAGLLLLAPIGPMMGGARLRRLAEAAREAPDGPVPDELRAAAADPSLWGPVYSLVGVSIGFLWIMSTKPDWVPAAIALLLTFGLGWVAGALTTRGAGRSASAEGSAADRASR